MGEIDMKLLRLLTEDELFISEVVQNDHELLMLDSYLLDIF